MNRRKAEKKRVAIYIRYSSENQRDGYSVEYQLDECKKYIKQHDMLFVNSYIDEATTGKTTANRSAFFDMLGDVKRGLYDCVVVYKYSRFARNLVEATLYAHQIEKAGAKLISAMERIDDSTPEGKMMRNIIMIMDEYYSDNLATFVQSSMHTAAKSGRIMGGTAPLGYRLNSDKRLEIDEHEAEIIRSIFGLYASGFSLADILRWTVDKGYRTRRGNPFTESALYVILRNEKYIGRFVYEVKGYDAIIIEDAVPRIIDDETWHRVQEKISECLQNKHQPKPRLKERSYPLTGKIVCGCCGNSYIGSAKVSRKRNQDYSYYVCRGKKKMKICHNKDIRKEQVEDFVFGEIKKRLLNPDIIDRIARETYEIVSDGTGDIEAEIKKLKAEKTKIEKRLEILLDAMLDGEIPKSVMNKKSEKLNAELEAIQKQLDEKQVAAVTSITYEKVYGYLEQLMNDLEHGDNDMKKAVINQMVRSITIYEDRVDAEIGVNYRYFFRDSAKLGRPGLRVSLKREHMTEKWRKKIFSYTELLTNLKDALFNTNPTKCAEWVDAADHIISEIETDYEIKKGSEDFPRSENSKTVR